MKCTSFYYFSCTTQVPLKTFTNCATTSSTNSRTFSSSQEACPPAVPLIRFSPNSATTDLLCLHGLPMWIFYTDGIIQHGAFAGFFHTEWCFQSFMDVIHSRTTNENPTSMAGYTEVSLSNYFSCSFTSATLKPVLVTGESLSYKLRKERLCSWATIKFFALRGLSLKTNSLQWLGFLSLVEVVEPCETSSPGRFFPSFIPSSSWWNCSLIWMGWSFIYDGTVTDMVLQKLMK